MKRSLTTALLAGALLLAACGDDRANSNAETTDAGAARPERIVSLSPSATEMLFAVGAGDDVVAVDRNSDFPPEVLDVDRGLSGFEPNVEAIAGFEPDLVVVSDDIAGVVDGLEALDIEVLHLPAAKEIDDAYQQISALGQATGLADEAGAVVDEMRSQVDDLVARIPARAEGPTFFHELEDTLYTVTSDTFVGQVYELAGLRNIADAADPEGKFGGYPQLTSEFVVQADPDFIFLADAECCRQDASKVAARPGFASLTAVTADQVVELDEDISSRWGPRLVDFLRFVVEATT